MMAEAHQFSFSVFAIEHSIEAPVPQWGDPEYSLTFSRSVKKCPVLHLFGYTTTRHSVCVHLHGQLPYFLVPVHDASLSAVDFAAQLEMTAIRMLRLDTRIRLLHQVDVVQAVPFYGFSQTPRLFFKIYVYLPNMVAKLANLLGSTAAVCGRRWQPYEGHSPYHFQTMVDLGFSGMSRVVVEKGEARQGTAATALPTGDFFTIGLASKVSTADIELDVDVKHFQPTQAAPGAQLLFVKKLLSSYLASVGQPDSILADAVATDGQERWSVSRVQALDPLIPLMRQRIQEIELERLRRKRNSEVGDGAAAVASETKVDVKDAKQAADSKHSRAASFDHRSVSDPCVAPTPKPAAIAGVIPAFAQAHRPASMDPDVYSILAEARRALNERTNEVREAPPVEYDLGDLDACPTFAMLEGLDHADLQFGPPEDADEELEADEGPASSSDSDNGDDDDDPLHRVKATQARLERQRSRGGECVQPQLTYLDEGLQFAATQLTQGAQHGHRDSLPAPAPVPNFDPELTDLIDEVTTSANITSSPCDVVIDVSPSVELLPTPECRVLRETSLSRRVRSRPDDAECIVDSEPTAPSRRGVAPTSGAQGVIARWTPSRPPPPPTLVTSVSRASLSRSTSRFHHAPTISSPAVVAHAEQLTTDFRAVVAAFARRSQSPASAGLASQFLTDRYRKLNCILDTLTRPTNFGALRPIAAPRPVVDDRVKGARRAGRTAGIAFLKIVAVEVWAQPSPEKHATLDDPIVLAAVSVSTSAMHSWEVKLVTTAQHRRMVSPSRTQLAVVDTEAQLLRSVMQWLREHDPDIIISWDTQRNGLSQFLERYRRVIHMDPFKVLSRLQSADLNVEAEAPDNETGHSDEEQDLPEDEQRRFLKNSSNLNLGRIIFGDRDAAPAGDGARSANLPLARQRINIPGRVVIGVGRVVRSEVKSKSYTIQAMSEVLLGRPFPDFSDYAVTTMLRSLISADNDAALVHAVSRLETVMLVARHLDLFVRTSEMAQIYGILFVEVLSRGSQFRVEATLHRFAKPLGFVMVSPSREQVMMQNRQEGIALVMEPYSAYYTDPVIVLDFRSLYPSVVIAYNLCYSTLLGKVSPHESKKIGAISGYRQPPGFADTATFAPSSAAFVPSDVREGVLPRMLAAILDTRFMVQACMKVAAARGDDEQRRVFDAQQTGLKLLANVTYGYAAATFSGRMPCSDVSDAIVLLGRQTLERAIRLIEGSPKWNAKVVYGDTDSLFIQLKGATREQAFVAAKEMVRAVNEVNPNPVTIKFEKVFHPCFMIVKKRYVGYAWESPSQLEAKFDAKGIESIRRDQCPLTSKMQTEMLRTLFDTNNLSALRQYFTTEVTRLRRGEVLPTDVILRRDVKLGTYARDSTLPPGARVALQLMAKDPGMIVAHCDRVPYVVTNVTAAKLKDMVRPATALIDADPPSINVDHYLVKHVIPSLNRIFNLVGIDFITWYESMPKVKTRHNLFSAGLVTWSREAEQLGQTGLAPQRARGSGLEGYYQHGDCAVCGAVAASVSEPSEPPVCAQCLSTGRAAGLLKLIGRVKEAQVNVEDCYRACAGCIHSPQRQAASQCRSVDCDNMFQRHFALNRLSQWNVLYQFLSFKKPPVPSAVAEGTALPKRPPKPPSRGGTSPADALAID